MNEKRILLKHLPEIIVSIFDYNGDNERITDFWCELIQANWWWFCDYIKMLHISECPRRAILVLEFEMTDITLTAPWLIYTIAATVTKFNLCASNNTTLQILTWFDTVKAYFVYGSIDKSRSFRVWIILYHNNNYLWFIIIMIVYDELLWQYKNWII